MRRFYFDGDFQVGKIIELSQEESNHAIRVLRIREGESVLALNGKGVFAHCVVSAVGESRISLQIEKVETKTKNRTLVLIQAILKGPKMDWLLEKATELGVDEIRLVVTERTVAKSEKIDRWQRILSSAMKQSGNAFEPKLFAPEPLEKLLSLYPDAQKFLLDPNSSKGLADQVSENAKPQVVLAIGPEGGFTADEERRFQENGFAPAALSHQVLRGETAALAAISIAAHSIDFCSSKGV